MKKNITINLYGQLYAIDEDAYQMLERYLKCMKNYFSQQEGGEEIADDIEHRVAEILWEKKEAGAIAVDLKTVKQIIEQIGNPSEIDNNDATNSTTNTSMENTLMDGAYKAGKTTRNVFEKIKNSLKNKRYYRDKQNAILGGVCAGLGQYFDGQDPLLWRIVTILLAFVSMGTTLIIYLIIWLIAPEAKLPEDYLRMKGKEVNSSNLSQEILNQHQEPKPTKTQISRCLGAILLLIVGVLALPFILITGSALLCSFVFIWMVGFNMPLIYIDPQDLWILNFFQDNWFITTGLLTCTLIAGIIPIYALVKMLHNNQEEKMKNSTKLLLFALWIIACVMSLLLLILTSYNFNQAG